MEGVLTQEPNTKRMAIDTVYTLSAILPTTIQMYKDHFMEVLKDSRSDKLKPIRDAACEALNSLRDLPPCKQDRIGKPGDFA